MSLRNDIMSFLVQDYIGDIKTKLQAPAIKHVICVQHNVTFHVNSYISTSCYQIYFLFCEQ